jgi:hypothetical protein
MRIDWRVSTIEDAPFVQSATWTSTRGNVHFVMNRFPGEDVKDRAQIVIDAADRSGDRQQIHTFGLAQLGRVRRPNGPGRPLGRRWHGILLPVPGRSRLPRQRTCGLRRGQRCEFGKGGVGHLVDLVSESALSEQFHQLACFSHNLQRGLRLRQLSRQALVLLPQPRRPRIRLARRGPARRLVRQRLQRALIARLPPFLHVRVIQSFPTQQCATLTRISEPVVLRQDLQLVGSGELPAPGPVRPRRRYSRAGPHRADQQWPGQRQLGRVVRRGAALSRSGGSRSTGRGGQDRTTVLNQSLSSRPWGYW